MDCSTKGDVSVLGYRHWLLSSKQEHKLTLRNQDGDYRTP